MVYLKRDPESQKHRVAEAGRSSGVTPLLKQGHLEPVAQEHGVNGFLFLTHNEQKRKQKNTCTYTYMHILVDTHGKVYKSYSEGFT